ncbi:MAG: DUF5683 domain-containing protein [Candidatus Omnitrophica bacterium]|jgi:type II secretory pathway pseudopilin PulG|nr:DUF5683 domain-containing protein [Candidatus Omnitrophota bacterium]
MKCVNHTDRDAVGVCNFCTKSICSECVVNLKGEMYCKECVAIKMKTVKKEEHSPALAAILSFIIAGLGQIYNGQVWKGLLIFVTSLLVIPWIIGIFDAYFVAKRISHGEIALKKKTGCLIAMIIWVFVFWIMVFILAMLAAIAIPNFMRARITASENAAASAIKSISSALESYAAQNNNVYPQSEESLLNLKPSYLPFAYNNRKVYGYLFKEELTPSGYKITATPVECGITGTKIYTIETRGKASESQCANPGSADYKSD